MNLHRMTVRSSVLGLILTLLPLTAQAANPGTANPAAEQSADKAKPGWVDIPRPDFTGYWVSLVTEDWRFRMVTPGPGEYAGIPITKAAKAAADAFDPKRDAEQGLQCKAWGAGTVMRVPARLHITWADAHTLKVEIDNGTQTRVLHIQAPGATTPKTSAPPSWQGDSVAKWDDDTLEVVTTNMRPGYIRSNGVPYGADAKLTEYWDVQKEADGSEFLIITSLLEDPVYLQDVYGFSPIFRKENDSSKWDPAPCK